MALRLDPHVRAGRGSHMIRPAWRNRELLLEMARREFALRYRGSVGGIVWSFLHPLSMLVVFSLAFGILFTRHAPYPMSDTTAYCLNIFPGLMVYQAFAETINRAPTLITGNAEYVKKSLFPLELFPLTSVAVALAHAAIGLVIWVLAYGLYFQRIPYGAILIPVVLAVFAPVLLCAGFLLSTLGVFFRELGHLTGPIGQAILFLSPVLYRLEDMPPGARSLLRLNPLTLVVSSLRTALSEGSFPIWPGLAVYLLVATACCWVAWRIFQLTRPHFADLI
jgi:lipopolysaccharide transport system permease protein